MIVTNGYTGRTITRGVPIGAHMEERKRSARERERLALQAAQRRKAQGMQTREIVAFVCVMIATLAALYVTVGIVYLVEFALAALAG